MNALISVLKLYLIIVVQIEAARILAVFPIPSISHQVVFRPLTQALAARGHEVIVITPDPAFPKGETPKHLTEIDVHNLSYSLWSHDVMAAAKGDQDTYLDQMKTVMNAIVTVFDAQLNNQEVKNIIRNNNQKFDLILTEACARPALVFSHIYKVPLIQVSSFGASIDNYVTVGAPLHPFLYPPMTHHRLNNLTVWEKLKQIYNDYFIEEMFENLKEVEHDMLKKHFGNNVPSINELNNNIEMLFLNVYPTFEGIRPVPPSVIHMGGLHQKPDKALPTELKTFLDSSKNGVIYISFGTNVDPSLLAPEKIQTLVNVVSKLPYNVLWKWNKDVLPGRTKNIKISKWLPQSDLLKHQNIKVFVTQGGLQSTDEAITAGVPLIGIPMLGDQWYNAEKYEYHKIGIRLDIDALTEEKFTKAINTIIEDSSYRRNIVRLRELILDQPMKPLDNAVWWTEYVLRHGGAKHLRSPAANISLWQYFVFKLISLILAILLLIVSVFIFSIQMALKYVIRFNNVTIKRKQS